MQYRTIFHLIRYIFFISVILYSYLNTMLYQENYNFNININRFFFFFDNKDSEISNYMFKYMYGTVVYNTCSRFHFVSLEAFFYCSIILFPKLFPPLLTFLGEKTNFARSTLCISEGCALVM